MRQICLSLWVLVLFAVCASSAQAGEDKELFNGRDLSGWKGDEQFWSVEDGAITGRTTAEKPTPKNTFLIWTGGTLRDFELTLKYKITGGNSGVQYRSNDNGDFVVSGYQADIVAARAGEPDKYSGILYEEKGRGILAERGQAVVLSEEGKAKENFADSSEIAKSIKQGDWNEYTIIARGNRLIQKINGVMTVNVIDNDKTKSAREGILALQIHTGPPMTIQFKEIRLKELPQP